MKRAPEVIDYYDNTNSIVLDNDQYQDYLRYTASLEQKLKIAEDALRKIEGQGFWGHNNSVDSLVKILDENTKIAEEALSKLKEE